MATKTMATAAHAAKAQGRLNLFDMPELMPGAQPSANAAQREEFEQRCRQLYDDAVAEDQEATEVRNQTVGGRMTASDLQAMFPALDAALVRILAAEAPTPQHAIETLLALAAATAEPIVGGQRDASPPPRDLGVEDMNKFPSLCDSDGWQVVSSRQLEWDLDEDLGSMWRDRAKAAASKPAPHAAPAAPDTARGARRRKGSQNEDADRSAEQPQFETDYEFRQMMGQKREQNRTKYGRGRGRGRVAPAQVAGGRGNGGRFAGEESASEDGEDHGDAGASYE